MSENDEKPQKTAADLILDSAETKSSFSQFLKSIEKSLTSTLAEAGINSPDIAFMLSTDGADDGLDSADQLLAYALAKGGFGHRELARLTGHSTCTIARKTTDPRIRRAVSLLQHAAGLPDVIARFKSLTPRAVEVMSELMNDESVPASTRLEAAKTIVERIHGKATTHIEADGNLLASLLEKMDHKPDEATSLLKDLPTEDDPLN